METDVVVVGSGAAGLTTAVVAAKLGLEVVLVERATWFGGTTAYSGGAAWIPFNHHMREVGISDSRAEAETYLRGVLGNFYDQRKVAAFLDHAAPMIAYLESNTDVKMMAGLMPDYETEVACAKSGRCIFTVEFDARELGAFRDRLRPPRRDTMLFDHMQLSMFDPPMLRAAHKNWQAFRHTCNLMARYGYQRIRYGRGMRVANGNALIARLMLSAIRAGVTLWNNAPAQELIVQDGAVTGVVVVKDGAAQRILTRKGVMLASGGFGANPEMRAKYIPHARYGLNLQPETNRGEGIQMGMRAGGTFNEGNVANGIFQPISPFPRADGSMDVAIYALDRLSPGSLIVDAATGRRFVNEGTNYHSFVRAMHAKAVARAWMISEAPATRKYGLGLVRPWPFPIKPWIKKGYVIEAGSIAALAVKLNIDPKVLSETVARFNENAERGVDPDFHRGADAYSLFMGDATHKPNPSLGPVQQKPFYAVPFIPGETSTVAGLDTNEAAQVLDGNGIPIKGLYATGADSNTMMRGKYPGGGSSIGPGMTFGYIAARRMAGSPV